MPHSNAPASPQPNYPDELVDKYRNIYVDFDDWFDNVQSEFKERMRAVGIDVDRIYFSGFWSQGDGAMFEGRIEDWGQYLGHLGYDDPILIEAAVGNWYYKWTHSGHYYHEHSVSYDDGVFSPENPYTSGYWSRDIPEEEQFRGAVWDAMMERHDLLALTEKIQEDLRDHMRDLYRELEKEYDYLTSDEAVIEWMVANEIDPNEDELTEQE